MMRIDAHQHYWNPARGDYGWMPKDNPTLYRSYMPRDLRSSLKRHRIDGTVLVQAAASVEETEYMLGLADSHDSIRGVVGWVDFEDRSHLKHLERLAQHPKFCGVRPMIQDIADPAWMHRPDVQWAYEAIIDLDLTFDALGLPQHLAQFVRLLDRYPSMRCVIDHMMKPQIRDARTDPNALTSWAQGISQIANSTQAFCKISGIVTESLPDWTVDDLRPFTDVIVKSFGADRIMWGSDWPVCNLRSSYDRWRSASDVLFAELDPDAQDAINGGTAMAFYRL